jgi:hypothetical protein
MRFPLFIFLLATGLMAMVLPRPSNLRVAYGEQSLDISWDSIPGASGYNLYNAPRPNLPLSKKQKVNPTLITSGPHFAYIWDYENGKRERRIKGRRHYLSVTTVFEKKGRSVESKPSGEADDFYFKGFCNMGSADKITGALRKSQSVPFLPVEMRVNKTDRFIRFMEGTGKRLLTEIKANIDPQQVGGCAPISTVLIKLLQDDSLYAYRIEGNFINEYHTFVILNLDSVEYVLDFSADQFSPDVAPVFFPRDLSHLNPAGKLAAEGRSVYLIGKIYASDQSELTDNASARIYRDIYARVSGKEK